MQNTVKLNICTSWAPNMKAGKALKQKETVQAQANEHGFVNQVSIHLQSSSGIFLGVMADYIRTWLIIFMQPLSSTSKPNGNTGLQARTKLNTRNDPWLFPSLFSFAALPQKDAHFHEDVRGKKKKKDISLPTCPNNDPGTGHDPCGQSHGSDPGG